MPVQEAITALHAEADDAITVLTMSAIAFWPEVRPHDFRLLGAMGAAGSIGLGLALGVPDRPVWVIDGDGSLLMQLAVVAAVADAAPRNLVHVVIDNGIYAISGGQPTPGPRDWAGLLRSAGYATVDVCDTPNALRAAVRRRDGGPRALVVSCLRERPAYPPGALAVKSAEEAARIRAALTAA